MNRGERLSKIKDKDIDFTDIPEVTKEQSAMFETITPDDYLEDHVVPPKITVNIRLDSDVVSFFQKQSSRYQTAINKVLRGYMLSHKIQK